MNTQKITEKLFYIFLGISFIFLFNKFFLDFFKKYLQEYISVLDIPISYLPIFIFMVFLFFCLSVKNYQKTVPSYQNTLFLFLIAILYTNYRFFNDIFIFFPRNVSLKFFDIIYIFIIIDVGNYLKIIFPNSPFPASKLYGDSPILKEADNELGDSIEKFVNKIFKILNENCFNTAYSIGMDSRWGEGKTSVINYIQKKIKSSSQKDDFIVIDFNPWLSFDGKVLISDFFNSITEKLSDDSLSRHMLNYSDKLISKEGNKFYEFIKELIPFIQNDTDSLEKLFDEINKKIGILNKKLVIFIDDVDRLDNMEVFQLLKLIRNTANFKNTFFIVAYDREYVNNAIVKINSFPSNNYLNKIINVELSLPYYDKRILSEIFVEKVIKLIGEKYRLRITEAMKVFHTYDIFYNNFESENEFGFWIDNMREVKKLADLIYINFNELLDEIDFEDMLYLEILQVKYPNVYRKILDSKNSFFYENNGKLYIRIKSDNFENRDKDINDFDKSYFKLSLDDLSEKGFLLKEDIGKVVSLFKKLFNFKNDGSIFQITEDINRDRLRVNNSRKFERYFAQIISRENISETEWSDFLNINNDKVREEKINDWIKDGKEEDLIIKLESIDAVSSLNELKLIIKTVFQLGNSDSKLFSGKINITSNLLSNLFLTKNKSIVNIITQNKREIKQLLISQLEDNNKFNLSFLFNFYSESPYSAIGEEKIEILERNEAHEILKKYFFKYLKENQGFGTDFWSYYQGAKTYTFDELETDNRIELVKDKYFDDDVKTKLLLYAGTSIEKIENFFMFFIQKYLNDENLYTIRMNLIKDLFEDTEAFEKYLSEMINMYPNSIDLKEFRDFYNECEKVDFKTYINYNFIYITV